jgi:hypothetical protein
MYPSLREAKKRNNKFPEKQYLSVSRPRHLRLRRHDMEAVRRGHPGLWQLGVLILKRRSEHRELRFRNPPFDHWTLIYPLKNNSFHPTEVVQFALNLRCVVGWSATPAKKTEQTKQRDDVVHQLQQHGDPWRRRGM